MAVVVESLESRTILALVYFEDLSKLDVFNELLALLGRSEDVVVEDGVGVWRDPSLKVLDVERMMELAEILGSGLFGVVHIDTGGQPVGIDQAVDHPQAHWLHRVLLRQCELREVVVVEVTHLPHS